MRQKEFLKFKAANVANLINDDDTSVERANQSDIIPNNIEKHKRTKTLSNNQENKTLTSSPQISKKVKSGSRPRNSIQKNG